MGTVIDRLMIAAACIAAASCAGRLPLRRICPDGWPIRIIQHPECHRGICGYTCQPDRWRQERLQALIDGTAIKSP